jgi:hypothetical protein
MLATLNPNRDSGSIVLMRQRRIVTGHEKAKSVIVSDEELSPTSLEGAEAAHRGRHGGEHGVVV